MEQLKVIITGVTGMVGEGVLFESLNNQHIKEVLSISRRPSGYSHPKLKEILHEDFFDISPIADQLVGYDACFFCLGVTSVGKNEEDYTRLTYSLTLNFATTLSELNKDMTFCYISGSGTDSSEKGRLMWARVKGKTENDLMKLPFKSVYSFRPAAINPYLPLKPSQTYYKTLKYTRWMFPIIKFLVPNYIIDLKDFAKAMINAALYGYPKNVLEMKDIKSLAAKSE